MMYSKDFLLKYSAIKKKDPIIAEKLNQLVSPKTKKPTHKNERKWSSPESVHRSPAGPRSPASPEPTLSSLSDSKIARPNPRSPNMKPNASPSFQPKESAPKNLSSSTPAPTPTKSFSTPTYRPTDTPSPAVRPTSLAFTTPVQSPQRAHAKSPTIPVTPKAPETPSTPPKDQLITPISSPARPGASPKSPFRSPPRPISPLDEQRLMQRQKQIDYGYRTVGYLRYRLLVSKEGRRPEHPRTPKKNQGCSKRSWDGQLKKWRRDLHLWDPDSIQAFRAVLDSDLVLNIIKTNPELEEIVRIVKEKMDNPDANLDKDDEQEALDLDANVDLPEDHEAEREELEKANQDEIDSRGGHKVARTLVF
uniref:Histone RNA hairpin-binding protein RNA-binding domain-containing protein n=1 Tax=Arcella intermedia TaxID=1963864 RepID=A0A6B2L7N7_9EUKA